LRLFTAILLDKPIKDALQRAGGELRANSVSGRFTQYENLHLTLVFIGETGNAEGARRALEQVSFSTFPLALRGAGRFGRPSGGVYWCGVEKSPELDGVYRKVFSSLSREGFSPESRTYTPHLTMGREVVVREGFDIRSFSDAIPKLSMQVGKISLMRSERVEGRLVYTEIYARPAVSDPTEPAAGEANL